MSVTGATSTRQGFHPGMLVYDTRYRAATIQVVVVVVLMLFFSWLVSNTLQNLESLGKGVGFGFLAEPSNYDINQSLIEYSSRSSNLRAAVVGLLNTLLIAFMGCVLTTILGVIIGILRLSRNWLIARLMAVYVEGFRNVPLLVWIVFIMAILIETLPRIDQFRGDDPSAHLLLGESVAITNRGVYIPEPLFSRGIGDLSILGWFEVSLDFMVLLAVIAGGFVVSGWIRRRADTIQESTGIRPLVWPWRIAVIVLPPIALLTILGFHLGHFELTRFNFKGGIHLRNSLLALWLALSLYTAAFVAEIVRSGILAVSKGQTEAAYSLGIRPRLTMSLVILPQALRVIIPPLISQYLNLTKNSSLAIAIGYQDITATLGGTTLNQTGREIECILLLMLIYLAISLSISSGMNWYNSRVKLQER